MPMIPIICETVLFVSRASTKIALHLGRICDWLVCGWRVQELQIRVSAQLLSCF